MKKQFYKTDEQARRVLGISRDEYAYVEYVAYRTQPKFTDVPGWCSDKQTIIAKEVDLSERGLFNMSRRLCESGILEKHPTKNIYKATSKWEDAHKIQNELPKKPERTSEKEPEQSADETGTMFRKNRNDVPKKPERSADHIQSKISKTELDLVNTPLLSPQGDIIYQQPDEPPKPDKPKRSTRKTRAGAYFAPGETLRDRKLAFWEHLKPYQQKYGLEMLKSFGAWWCEPVPGTTEIKLDSCKTFCIAGRLATWAKKDKTYGMKAPAAMASGPSPNRKASEIDFFEE